MAALPRDFDQCPGRASPVRPPRTRGAQMRRGGASAQAPPFLARRQACACVAKLVLAARHPSHGFAFPPHPPLSTTQARGRRPAQRRHRAGRRRAWRGQRPRRRGAVLRSAERGGGDGCAPAAGGGAVVVWPSSLPAGSGAHMHAAGGGGACATRVAGPLGSAGGGGGGGGA